MLFMTSPLRVELGARLPVLCGAVDCTDTGTEGAPVGDVPRSWLSLYPPQ